MIGTKVSDLTGHYQYPGMAQLLTVTNFEATIGQQAGQVLSGYITPPATGAYTFYLASAHGAELWLSPNENPGNSVKVAEEFGTNTKRNWPGYGVASHISAPVSLTQGRWYFIRAIHKSGLGTGLGTPHLAVAWKLPGGQEPSPGGEPIPGAYLRWALPASGPNLGASLRIAPSETGKLLLILEKIDQASFTLEGSNDLVTWQTISTDLSSRELDLLTLDPSSSTERKRFFRVIGR